jgi:hypothetical protein
MVCVGTSGDHNLCQIHGAHPLDLQSQGKELHGHKFMIRSLEDQCPMIEKPVSQGALRKVN